INTFKSVRLELLDASRNVIDVIEDNNVDLKKDDRYKFRFGKQLPLASLPTSSPISSSLTGPPATRKVSLRSHSPATSAPLSPPMPLPSRSAPSRLKATSTISPTCPSP
ncbi:MAG: hypothetical protein U0L83_02795, partial [Muribaculaceae bacterium]|nr:hypothetical protein [Muribaculaceae bacterium]